MVWIGGSQMWKSGAEPPFHKCGKAARAAFPTGRLSMVFQFDTFRTFLKIKMSIIYKKNMLYFT